MRPVYRGTATILINKENPQVVDFKEVFTVNTMDLDYYQTQYRILESRTLAKKVTQTLRLAEHPEFLPQAETSPFQAWKAKALAYLNTWLAFLGQSSPDRPEGEKESLKETNLVNDFLRKLEIEPIRNSRLLKVHFDSHYPELSTRVPNTLAAAYIQQNLENRFTSTEQAKEWLTRQLEELKGKVEQADETLQAFGSKHDIISLEEKENITMQRLSELNETLAKAESDRMAKEAWYNQTHERGSNPSPPSWAIS